MSLLSGKHDFGDLNGQTVTFVERKVSLDRADFLKKLLEHNGIPVILVEIPPAEDDPDGATLYTVATPDLVFNAVTYVYQRRLRTADGRKVTPAYWNQETEATKPEYWEG
jgi:hypothetical protein